MGTELDPDNPKKEYTGVWIPKAVMECDGLSPTDKIVYGEIACFSKCYGSNKWLAARIGRSEVTASRAVNRLIRMGFVELVGTTGNIRFLKARASQKRLGRLIKNDKAGLSKMTSIDKRIDKSIDNIESKDSMAVKPAEAPVRSQRSLDIDQAFVIWEEVMGYPLQAGKKERLSINSILSRKGMDLDKLRLMVQLVAESQLDRYKRFSIASYTDLLYKTNDLMAWAREKQAQNHTNATTWEV